MRHGKDSGGCARAFTILELGVQEIVQRNGDTEVDLGTRKPGKATLITAVERSGDYRARVAG
ncbi:hypothetical protein AB0D12_13200 [Streptomyces sp. NPDC048479]|uniref:hypothetical protein n=1 Tax=Streptomyces sp. NPDC048479 TaxID=3154725 RepID=UPI003444A045